MNTNDAIKILKESGLKYTDKYKNMLDIFIKEDKYIDTKYIQQVVDENYPGISSGAVYGSLHLFKDLGIIGNTELDDRVKFRIICASHHHHHFVCEKRGDMKVIDHRLIDQIKLSLPGVSTHKHKLEVYGVYESYQG